MEIKALHTKIKKQENIDIGIAILEDYFAYPKGKSNLYLINREGKIMWFAKLPSTHDTFVNFEFDIARNLIIAWTWEGIMCDIDIVNGIIKKETFVK